ncbi:MAG TPA: hypothetical protein VNO55_31535 [Polyangia bacterium]|nr:hypothetical protein [Polyangia bacterium]
MTGSGGAGGGGTGGAGGSGGAVTETTDAGSGGVAVIDAAMETPPREAGDSDATDAAPASHAATLVGANPTTLVGNAAGGSPYQDDCPAGQALIGFSGNAQAASATMDSINRQIAAHCGIVQIVGTTVTVKPGATLPARGMAGTMAWTRTCPADQVIVGFSGRTGSFVDQLVFVCAPVTAASSAVGTTLTPGATTTSLTAIGGNGGMAFATVKCATGQLGAGSLVREGDVMDAFSIVCGRATIAP